MAFFTPEKGYNFKATSGGGFGRSNRACAQARLLRATVRREIDRLEAGTLNYTACAAQAHRAAAGNARPPMVRLKAKGSLYFDSTACLTRPSGFLPSRSVCCSVACRWGRDAVAATLSFPPCHLRLARERARCPEQPALWRGRGGRRRSTRPALQATRRAGRHPLRVCCNARRTPMSSCATAILSAIPDRPPAR